MSRHQPRVRAALALERIYLARAVAAAEQMLTNELTDYQRVLTQACTGACAAGVAGWPQSTFRWRRHLCGLARSVKLAVERAFAELQKPAVFTANLRGLIAELDQLADEFGELDVNLRQKTLRVTTGPITLEDVHLGSFTIGLSWPRLTRAAGSDCFEIVALDPNPAATDDAVTHPHVKRTTLCAGDAGLPIRRALEQGRLVDAFCLVRGVLTTYNAGSPHVQLEDWGGQNCGACGDSVAADDLCYCERCGQDYCSDCVGCCPACHHTRCWECLELCPFCKESFCAGCLVQPAGADQACCQTCLQTCAQCAAQFLPAGSGSATSLCPTCRTAAVDVCVSTTGVNPSLSEPSSKENHETDNASQPLAV